MLWAVAAAHAQPSRPPGVQPPSPGEVLIWAASKTAEGPIYHLRGSASLQTDELQLWADELDYNEETGAAEARGNVRFQHFERGEELWADRADYNLRNLTGRFYDVRGTSPPRIDYRPGLLTTSNPFYFEARWAERLKEQYILHSGFITDCRLPKPWWTFRASRFVIIPGHRATARGATFRLRSIPLLYVPYFYKSLEEQPRQSGFLTPNAGNSSRRGKMIGVGYYWAINRSYDATYRAQWFTQRGFAHYVDWRGKPTQDSEFSMNLFGVNDKGDPKNDFRKEGGIIVSAEGKAALPRGFEARLDATYLSSMVFRRAFTESFTEAIYAEIRSVGYVDKHWSGYGFNVLAERTENIQDPGAYDPDTGSYKPDVKTILRKLPEFGFTVRPKQVGARSMPIPIWVSLESSGGLVRRTDPRFQTRQFMDRLDFQPRLMTAVRWKGFSLVPSFALRETHYGSSLNKGELTGSDLIRQSREFSLELAPPSVSRVFNGPGWLGDKVKHVIEPRAVFRHVSGVDNYDRIIRFGSAETVSDTTEAEFSIANRLFVKRGDQVSEVLSWEVWQSRFFNPDFGGAVSALDPSTGKLRRNVIASSLNLTAFSFLDGPRHYSPVVSALRIAPLSGLGMEWRTDYDPLWRRPVNSWLTADWRHSIYSVMVGHNLVRSGPQLSARGNEFNGRFTFGNDNRRGWNAAFDALHDFRTGITRWATAQVTYNTDCCGFSVQYRRFDVLDRKENLFRVAFSIANIGSFGSLRRQDRLF